MSDDIKDMIQYPDEDGDNGDTEEAVQETEQETAETAEPEQENSETAEPEQETAETEESEETSLQADETDKGEEYFSSDNDDTGITETDFSDEPPKSGGRRIIKYAVIAAAIFAVMCVFSMIDTGVIGTYKRNFATNVSGIMRNMGINLTPKAPKGTDEPLNDLSAISEDSVSEDSKTEQTKVKATPKPEEREYNTDVDFSNIVPFETASESKFAVYKKGIVCAKSNYICYINSSGKIEWEMNTSVIDPILKAEGDYILIAQKNGTKMCLYEDKKLLYDINTDANILSCGLSMNGDAAVVVNRQSYRGAFSVYNKSGDEIYSWSSGSHLVLCAVISKGSRRVAASLLNTDGKVKSTVMLFNINKEDSYASADFEDTILFNIKFVDETVNAFGDNSMIGMDTSGKVLFDKRFDDVEVTNYAIDDKGTKIMVFSSENIPMMSIYNSAGALKYTVTTQTQSDYADIDSYNLIYNDNRDIFLGKPNSRRVSKYTASMDIKDLVLIDSRTFVIVYFNSLEFVRM